ncbi:MAG: hypothetical protein WKF40_03625 [Thermoleophilaceae bacterium]
MFETQYETLEWLSEHGFKVNADIERHDDLDAVVKACRGWEERRESLDYEIDGVVVKVDDLEPPAPPRAWWAASRAARSPGSSRP